MPAGRIKWFNREIGAGFIRSEEGTEDILRIII